MADVRSPALTRYSRIAIWLHWIIAFLVIANIGLAELTEDLSREARAAFLEIHKSSGITILFLTVLRIGWRVGHKSPPWPAHVPRWQRLLARATHVLFYALLLVLPLTGWIWMSTASTPLAFWGQFDVSIAALEGKLIVAGLSEEAHEVLGKAMIAVIVLHLLGVAKHVLVDRDQLLGRMWAR